MQPINVPISLNFRLLYIFYIRLRYEHKARQQSDVNDTKVTWPRRNNHQICNCQCNGISIFRV